MLEHHLLLILLRIHHFHDSRVVENALTQANKALLHVDALPRTRLQKRDFMFRGQPLPVHFGNLPHILQVCFIANQNDLDSAAEVRLDLVEPELHIRE